MIPNFPVSPSIATSSSSEQFSSQFDDRLAVGEVVEDLVHATVSNKGSSGSVSSTSIPSSSKRTEVSSARGKKGNTSSSSGSKKSAGIDTTSLNFPPLLPPSEEPSSSSSSLAAPISPTPGYKTSFVKYSVDDIIHIVGGIRQAVLPSSIAPEKHTIAMEITPNSNLLLRQRSFSIDETREQLRQGRPAVKQAIVAHVSSSTSSSAQHSLHFGEVLTPLLEEEEVEENQEGKVAMENEETYLDGSLKVEEKEEERALSGIDKSEKKKKAAGGGVSWAARVAATPLQDTTPVEGKEGGKKPEVRKKKEESKDVSKAKEEKKEASNSASSSSSVQTKQQTPRGSSAGESRRNNHHKVVLTSSFPSLSSSSNHFPFSFSHCFAVCGMMMTFLMYC